MKKELLLPDLMASKAPPPDPSPDAIRYEPLVEEVRGMVRDLRESDPGMEELDPMTGRPKLVNTQSLRGWAKKLYKRTRLEVAYRTVKKIEEETIGVDLGYVIASAIAADVEIVLGRRPRVLRDGIDGIARDLFRQLRNEAANDPRIDPNAVESLRSHYEQVVGRRVRTLQT